MAYAIGAYLLIGVILIFIGTPWYLKRNGFDTFQFKKSHLWLLLLPDSFGATIMFGLLTGALWPLIVPAWILSEFHDRKIKEERKKNRDKYYGMSMEQKIEALKNNLQDLPK